MPLRWILYCDFSTTSQELPILLKQGCIPVAPVQLGFLICPHLHMLLHLPLQFEGLGKDIKSIYMEELGEVVPLFYILPTITKIFIYESSVCVERDETTTGIHQQVNFIKPENIGKLGNGELDQQTWNGKVLFN